MRSKRLKMRTMSSIKSQVEQMQRRIMILYNYINIFGILIAIPIWMRTPIVKNIKNFNLFRRCKLENIMHFKLWEFAKNERFTWTLNTN